VHIAWYLNTGYNQRLWFSTKTCTCSCYSTKTYANSAILILKLNLTSLRNIYIKMCVVLNEVTTTLSSLRTTTCDALIVPSKTVLKVQWTRQFRVGLEVNEACLFEMKVWRNKTALIVEQLIYYLLTMMKFRNSLNLKTPSLEY